MRTQFGTILATTLVLGAFADANVLWVDKATGVDGAGRGAESAPYRTIQAAVSAAPTGYTIKVKPGVYDEGTAKYNNWNNRVLISGKVLKIVSIGGKEVTHITGSGTIRCICFNDAAGSVVEGFTIRDGKSRSSGEVDSSGCGVMGITADSAFSSAQGCVVDCVVSNCVAVRGTFRGATAVRCWITENTASNSGGAGRQTDFVNCLITRNTGAGGCVYSGCKVVNCTVVDNDPYVRSSVSLYNSVVHNNADGSNGERNVGNCSLDHCVTRIDGYEANFSAEPIASITNASPLQFIAPLYDDFRVRKGSDAETAGEASLIGSAGVTVPAGVDLYKDLFGNAIPATGTIAAGCVQTVVEPQGGAILFSGRRDILTRGKMTYAKDLYAFAETWPTQFTVQAVNKGNPAIFSFVVNGGYVFPTMDDTVYLVPPETCGMVYTNSIQAATATYYVNPDPDIGSNDTADGTNPETPYETLQAAVDAVGSTSWCVVRAAGGDYRKGEKYGNVLTNRVFLSGNSGIRLIGAGADRSIIWGAPDPSTGGMGQYATRCVGSSGRVCVQGFTLRDGYARDAYKAADGKNADTKDQRGGGVCSSANKQNKDLHVLDCTITNCWAYRGGAGYSGAYERCHITDCYGNNGVLRYGTLVSCVVDNLAGSEMTGSGNNNLFGCCYNTTFIGRDTDEYVVCRNSGNTLTNCIVMTTKELLTGTAAAGSFAWDVPTFTVESGITLADPKLVDVAGGDYRPAYYDCHKVNRADESSPALGAGVWFDLPGFSVTDYDGKPLRLVAGKPTVGAYQWPLVIVKKPGFFLIFR